MYDKENKLGNLFEDDLINQAKLGNHLYCDELLIIDEKSSEALNKAIIMNLNKVAKIIVEESNFINLQYLENSAIYQENKSFAKFVATPMTGYTWQDFSSDEIYFDVELLNVDVLDVQENHQNDANAPYHDVFKHNLIIDELSDAAINKALLSLDLNNLITEFQNHNKYNNVFLQYIEDTASWETKTFKIIITPLQGHFWIDNSQNSMIATVSIKNYSLKNNTVNDAVVDNLVTFNKLIEIETNKKEVVEAKILEMDLNSLIHYFYGANINEVKLSYVKNSIYVNENNQYEILLFATPNENHSWMETGLSQTKAFKVLLANVLVIVNNEENYQLTKNKNSVFYKFYNPLWTQINIPKSTRIDLWANQLFKNDEHIQENIFSDENLWKIFKILENEHKGIKALYWIKNSPKFLSTNLASIDIGVIPMNGYAWDDGQRYERKINVLIGGFIIQ